MSWFKLSGEDVKRLTLSQAVCYLEAIQQFMQMEFGFGRIFMNEAFAGVPEGKKATDVPSFWLTDTDTYTEEEWMEDCSWRGDKHPSQADFNE